MPQYSVWKVKTPLNTFLQFGPSFPLCHLTEGGMRVFWMAYTLFSLTTTKLSSQNSGALSVTMVLGTPFLANIVLNICLTVVAFRSLTFITSSHPERNLLRSRINRMCAWSIWTLVQACNLNLLCVKATSPWISLCTLLITPFLKIWDGSIASVQNITRVSLAFSRECFAKSSPPIVQFYPSNFCVHLHFHTEILACIIHPHVGWCFLLTYIMSKSNALILIAHLKILDVTLGNLLLELNKNSRGLWSDFKQNFLSNKKFCALSILQTMAMLELYSVNER